MRVLLASDFYPPFVGGTERQVQILATELAARGHDVHVATVWHEGLATEEVNEGVALHRVKALSTRIPWFSKDPKRRFHPPFPDASIVLSLYRLVHKYDIELVHAFGWIAYSCVVAIKGSKAAFVVSAQDYGYSCAIHTLMYKNQTLCSGPQFAKCLSCVSLDYGRPKALVAVSGVFLGKPSLRQHTVHALSTFVEQMTKRDLMNARARGRVVTIPPPVISESDFSSGVIDEEAEPYLQSLPDQPYILFIGAMRKFKGINELLEAYTRLDPAPPLVIIGSTWTESPTVFPPNVIVIKNAPRNVVMKICEQALFLVSPSTYPEPFGGVVLEALVKGKPVIGSINSGHEDMIVDGENGFLVDPADVDLLTRSMQRLVDDVPFRERLGVAARETAKSFATEVIMGRFEELYSSSIRRRA